MLTIFISKSTVSHACAFMHNRFFTCMHGACQVDPAKFCVYILFSNPFPYRNDRNFSSKKLNFEVFLVVIQTTFKTLTEYVPDYYYINIPFPLKTSLGQCLNESWCFCTWIGSALWRLPKNKSFAVNENSRIQVSGYCQSRGLVDVISFFIFNLKELWTFSSKLNRNAWFLDKKLETRLLSKEISIFVASDKFKGIQTSPFSNNYR